MSTSAITSYYKDNAIKQLEVITRSIKQTLLRIYTLSSHSFHVLIRELIPSARFDKSSLFTHIKGARTDHIISLQAYHGKTRSSRAVALTPEQLKPHLAAHTLKFLEDTHVEIDDDAPHYTWSEILTATRTPSMTVFAWVVDADMLPKKSKGKICIETREEFKAVGAACRRWDSVCQSVEGVRCVFKAGEMMFSCTKSVQ
jgi:hypothetical protein